VAITEKEVKGLLRFTPILATQRGQRISHLETSRLTEATQAPELFVRRPGSGCRPSGWAIPEGDQRSDIWSLGVVLWELCFNELPFGEDADRALMASRICRRGAPPFPREPARSPELLELIRLLMAPLPAQRPTAAQILGSPFALGAMHAKQSQQAAQAAAQAAAQTAAAQAAQPPQAAAVGCGSKSSRACGPHGVVCHERAISNTTQAPAAGVVICASAPPANLTASVSLVHSPRAAAAAAAAAAAVNMAAVGSCSGGDQAHRQGMPLGVERVQVDMALASPPALPPALPLALPPPPAGLASLQETAGAVASGVSALEARAAPPLPFWQKRHRSKSPDSASAPPPLPGLLPPLLLEHKRPPSACLLQRLQWLVSAVSEGGLSHGQCALLSEGLSRVMAEAVIAEPGGHVHVHV